MTAAEIILQLTASQADCLKALKQGLNGKMRIALHAKRDLKTVAAALERLSRAKLIQRHDRNSWRPTGVDPLSWTVIDLREGGVAPFVVDG